jgi:APA family basic amino acid/polyamine antiporter
MLLNWLGLRAGSRVQEVTSLTKALALIALVVVCFLVSPRAVSSTTVASQSLTQLPPLGLLIAIILALQPIIVSYDGWYGAIYFTEEDEDPARNLPRSSIIGVLACGAIFLLVNAALLHVLPIDKLGASQMPAADAAALIFGGYGRTVILVLSLVTAISTINASLMITPRILFAMARDGLMPGSITSINSGGTPTAALLLCTAASIGLVLSGSFETLVAMAAILFVAVYMSGFLSLHILRSVTIPLVALVKLTVHRGGGRSGNPAALAGFPSEEGKSCFWTFPRSGFFHRPLHPPSPRSSQDVGH